MEHAMLILGSIAAQVMLMLGCVFGAGYLSYRVLQGGIRALGASRPERVGY